MIFPWFSVLADDPGFYTLFPDLESWQETQEPFNLREHFGDIIKDDAPEFMYEDPKRIVSEEYFHHISGDSTVYDVGNIVELRAVLTSVDRVTNELTGMADCRFPLTIALPAIDDAYFYMAGSTGSWYKRSRLSVVP